LLTKSNLLDITPKGLYSPQADLFIDPHTKGGKAIITHGHSDHASRGQELYIAHKLTAAILRKNFGKNINVKAFEYGEQFTVNGVKICLHPAGHVPGSAQIRLEYKGETAVVSGDYKIENDGFTTPFEPVKCNVFVTESTFALPIYSWQPQKEIFNDINNWWRKNREKGKVSILTAYPLGKSQRLLYNVDSSIGKIYSYANVYELNNLFIEQGLKLLKTEFLGETIPAANLEGSLIIASSSISRSPVMQKIKSCSIGFASGWMNSFIPKRMGNIDTGFAISDHADWDGLNEAIKETGAEKIYVTHGFTAQFAKWLKEKGFDANVL
jgi:putative mRNA 3-end processing factor